MVFKQKAIIFVKKIIAYNKNIFILANIKSLESIRLLQKHQRQCYIRIWLSKILICYKKDEMLFLRNDNMSINRWQHSFYLRGRERIRLRPKKR